MNKHKSLRSKIQFAEITDTGKVRDHNEDAIGADRDLGLMVLADGMGGYNAGFCSVVIRQACNAKISSKSAILALRA